MVKGASALQIRGFKGLNIREDPSVIQDNELTDCTNFDIGRAGELTKRTGFTQLHSGSTLGSNVSQILGHFLTDTVSQIIIKAGSNVYYSTDGTTMTLLGTYADASYGVQYSGKFYIIRSGNTVIQWDGTTASAITGSPSGTFAILHKDRMFVLNSSAAGSLNSRYYFSKAGDVTSTGWVSTNFIDVRAGDGDFLVAMAIIQDLLVIFKGKSTWALYVQGSTTDWVQRSLNLELGCVSKYAIKQIEGYLYVSSAVTIFRTDGTTFESIFDPLQPVLKDRIVNLTTVNVDSFAYWQDKLICLLAPDPATRVYYIYHLKIGGWTQWSFSSSMKPWTFVEIRTNTPQRGLYCGDLNSTGLIFRYGDTTSYTDLGTGYTVTMATKQFDMDTPTNMKRGKWLAIDCLANAVLSWQHDMDGLFITTGTVQANVLRRAIKIPGPGYFRHWKFTVSASNTVAMTIISAILEVDGRRTLIKAST